MPNLNKLKSSIFCIGIICSNISIASSLVGYWQSNDIRETHQNTLVRIQKKHGEYQAYVTKATGNCSHCRGTNYQKPIQGMNILWGFKLHSKNLYDAGYFLDTHSGRIYRAKLKLNSKQLLIRSFVGIPMLGQTHIWQRYHP